MSDIVNAIDALIEEQLSQGEPERGFDAGDPGFPSCSHCDRDWHGFPLTERVAAMYRRGSFDEGYSVKGDESLVLCPGSNFIGPIKADGVTDRRTFSCLDLLSTFMQEISDEARAEMELPTGRYMVFDFSYNLEDSTLTVEYDNQ